MLDIEEMSAIRAANMAEEAEEHTEDEHEGVEEKSHFLRPETGTTSTQ